MPIYWVGIKSPSGGLSHAQIGLLWESNSYFHTRIPPDRLCSRRRFLPRGTHWGVAIVNFESAGRDGKRKFLTVKVVKAKEEKKVLHSLWQRLIAVLITTALCHTQTTFSRGSSPEFPTFHKRKELYRRVYVARWIVTTLLVTVYSHSCSKRAHVLLPIIL